MLKLKDGFILRQVAGETVVIPSGDAVDLNIMITLNDTGRFIWEKIDAGIEEDALVAAITGEYDIDETTTKAHVAAFVKKLSDNGFLA